MFDLRYETIQTLRARGPVSVEELNESLNKTYSRFVPRRAFDPKLGERGLNILIGENLVSVVDEKWVYSCGHENRNVSSCEIQSNLYNNHTSRCECCKRCQHQCAMDV